MQPYQTLEDFLVAAVQGIVFPRIYFDTNVILDLIEHRSRASLRLFNFLIQQSQWRLYTSVFAQVEIYEKKQKDEFRRQKELANWSNERILKKIDQRDLSDLALHSIFQQVDADLNAVISHLENITHLDEYGWDMASDIKKNTNLPDHDSIHLAEALAIPCDIMLTRDKFLMNVAEDYLWVERPERVINILEGYMGSLPIP